MTDTTYDEARRCPICNELGSLGISTKGPHGSHYDHITCKNDRCRWYNAAPWLIQIHRDGTVQPKVEDREKQFKTIPDRTDAVNARLQRDLEQQMRPGGEVTR